MKTLYPFTRVIVEGRQALFLYFMWKGERYGRIRFLDTNERKTVPVMDIGQWSDAVEKACARAVREVFPREAAE